ncbi:2-phospho-L-lactate guanylyltransferase [Agilicoccus flavus]|uniref:2-phospho-L-lactate guanylyltransferase n=1 Tax=Agilicoccus flavus TaxID=2775968 RepID=UPI001CF6F33A|nr:2-phospho-L-lactate guanylyltransferase [Agilicoccus flavus]
MSRTRLVVPVKGGAAAKSRLVPPSGVDRASLARALAQDTLSAVAALADEPAKTAGRSGSTATAAPVEAVVVTSDADVAGLARSLGLGVVADPGAGLNAAVRAGWAGAPGAAAALLGDVPAVRAPDLAAAFEAAADALAGGALAAFVPDADGIGTVFLLAAGAGFDPRFGGGSAAAHARTARRLDLDLPRLRRDVDDASDLRAATRLGLGAATARLLRAANGGERASRSERDRGF